MKTSLYICLLVSLSIGLFGCRGGLLNIFVVPEQTVLENQIIGTYEELGRDLTVFASVRAIQPDGSLSPMPPTTASRQAVLEAMRNRQYNNDDVQLLLRNGVVGEARSGLLVQRVESISAVENLSADVINTIITEENQDRRILIERLITTTPGVSPQDQSQVEWVFATLNHNSAPTGAWLESREGQWRQKP